MQTLGMNPSNLPKSNSAFSERRQRPRHKIQTPAYARISGEPKGFLLDLNTILDLSEEGMCIQAPTALGVDHVLDLCLELAEATGPIYTAGKVVWSNRLGRAGIRFGALSEASTQQLKRWLFLNAISGVADSKSADSKSNDAKSDDLKSAGEAEEPELPKGGPNQLRDSIESLETTDRLADSADHTELLAALSAVRREVEALGTNIRAVLELVTDRAFKFSHSNGSAIALSNGVDIICRARAGSDAPSVGARVSSDSGLSGECIRLGELLYCEDSENDSRVDREACRSLGIRSIVAVPIYDGEKVAGLLEVFSREPASFGFHANMILQNLAGMVGYALESVAMELGTVQNTTAKETAHDIEPVNAGAAPHGITQAGQLEVSDISETVPTSGVLESDEEARDMEVAEWHSWFRRALFVVALLTVITAVLWVFLSRKGSQAENAAHPVSAAVTNPASGTVAPLDQQRKLAEQGDAAVQFAIGARYATGDEVKQNYAEAARWFSMAAAQGNVSAQATLAAYYLSGTGVPKDASKAYFWALLAQAGGDEASKYRVEMLVPRMTRSQVAAVQEQANEWLKNHQVAKPR